jgi:hypothetical protein
VVLTQLGGGRLVGLGLSNFALAPGLQDRHQASRPVAWLVG